MFRRKQAAPATPVTCAMCGRSRDAHNRHVRFRLPDPVLATAEQDQVAGTWMSREDASKSVMLQVPEVGPFVRVLLPVSLIGGDTLTLGLWLGVHPDDFQHAFQEWRSPTYRQLTLPGHIANDVQPWGLLGRPATATVARADHTPYVTSSDDELVRRVIGEEWPHETVLDALPEALR